MMPPLPESEVHGRWLSVVAVIPDKWLFLVTGFPGHAGGYQDHPDLTTTFDEHPPLPNWRLRLDHPDAEWEPMAPVPYSADRLTWIPHCGAVGDELYLFGGMFKDPVMTDAQGEIGKLGLQRVVPYWGQPEYRDAFRYDPADDRWQPIRRMPICMAGGNGWVVVDDRYILLMGTADAYGRTRRIGRSLDRIGRSQERQITDSWRGFNDLILGYDIARDQYFRVGVMLYGVSTVPWVSDGARLYGFGGEPLHSWNGNNTENVLQIATIKRRAGPV
jgi:hypothetical protein